MNSYPLVMSAMQKTAGVMHNMNMGSARFGPRESHSQPWGGVRGQIT